MRADERLHHRFAALRDSQCTVKPWRPQRKELTGKMKEAADFIRKVIDRGDVSVTFRVIQGAIAVQSKNFRKLVTGRPEWPALLDTLGMET
jgi:hypothetical protein